MNEQRMSLKNVYVMLTMDCEPAKTDVTTYATRMSSSGPEDYAESERSIRAYVDTAKEFGFPTTLFVHPEIAIKHNELLLKLQEEGSCLGLHLHPYKLGIGLHKKDLGAYSAQGQRKILKEAVVLWEDALKQKPLYFRAGYFSANDNTFGVLEELGFKGGSVSCPGRVLTKHFSVWAGAHPYPHRADQNFRQLKGDSSFVEVPVSVDFKKPIEIGHAGQRGYEWLYIPSKVYNHKEILRDILDRFKQDLPKHPVIVTDTHNDVDYSDLEDTARKNFDTILCSIIQYCKRLDVKPIGTTMETLCNLLN